MIPEDANQFRQALYLLLSVPSVSDLKSLSSQLAIHFAELEAQYGETELRLFQAKLAKDGLLRDIEAKKAAADDEIELVLAPKLARYQYFTSQSLGYASELSQTVLRPDSVVENDEKRKTGAAITSVTEKMSSTTKEIIAKIKSLEKYKSALDLETDKANKLITRWAEELFRVNQQVLEMGENKNIADLAIDIEAKLLGNGYTVAGAKTESVDYLYNLLYPS